MSTKEIIAVLAHELAHAKKRHVLKQFALVLFPLLLIMNCFIIGLALSQSSIFLGLLACAIGFASIFLSSGITRRYQKGFEYEADAFAVKILGDPKPMINALEKLVQLNLFPRDNDSSTHPSITKRIQKIKGTIKNGANNEDERNE